MSTNWRPNIKAVLSFSFICVMCLAQASFCQQNNGSLNPTINKQALPANPKVMVGYYSSDPGNPDGLTVFRTMPRDRELYDEDAKLIKTELGDIEGVKDVRYNKEVQEFVIQIRNGTAIKGLRWEFMRSRAREATRNK